MRTKAQDMEFAKECLKIEKAGGDVLGYISKHYPSYTPRPVWYRLQKDCLKRTQSQFTEGHPAERKGAEKMSVMVETAREVMAAYDRGENIYDWLETHGYKNSSSEWYMLKQTMKEKDPALYERMCAVVKKTRAARIKATGREQVKAEKMMDKPTEQPEETKTAGTDTAHGGEGNAKKPPETKAYPIGGEAMEFKVKQLSSRLGVWECKGNEIVFSAHQFDGERMNVLVMSMKEWLNLAAEIPEAMKNLIESN